MKEKSDFEVAVIGSGPGGYVAAIRSSQLGLKTVCIEKDSGLGGTCLNVGCIPSKALLESSELYSKICHEAKEHGIEIQATFHLEEMMERKNRIISTFNQGISSLFKKNQVTLIHGKAHFKAPNQIEVDGKSISAKYIILATGSAPIALPFLPFDEQNILSSTGALALEKVPQKMIVIGAGVIGVEIGSIFRRLGSEVLFIEFLDRICPTLDRSLSKGLEALLKKQGLEFELSAKVTQGTLNGKEVQLQVERKDGTHFNAQAETVLVAIGRKPCTQGLCLEKVEIYPDQKGFLSVNDNFQTKCSHIFAIGDLIEGPMLAHKASEEGSHVAEIIAGKKSHFDYITIPSVVYTHPEVASCGLTEEEVKEKNIPYKIGQFPLKANSRALASGEPEGFVKIIIQEKDHYLLGIHILSAHAGELISLASLALKKRLTAKELAEACYAHPTFSEAIKEALLATYDKPIHI